MSITKDTNSGDPNEGSKLPMPGDGSPSSSRAGSSSGGASGSGSRPKPRQEFADTLQILTGGSASAALSDSASGTRAGASTNLDTILGQLVVEQGLATLDEVKACVDERKRVEEVNDKSLAQLLVENNFVTHRQLERLRGQAEAERSGQQIPGYRVQGKIGAGAMAAVFKAKQLSLDRWVAIKVLPRKLAANKQFIERFYAEGRAAAQLNHPNLVQAIDVGQAGEFHFFVMEFVEGKTVHDLITENKRFSEAEALDIAIMVADALRHAHDKGLIHRDVKPKNIILMPNGIAKLADLGLARAVDDREAAEAEKGRAFGTPYYISPEQIRGEVNVGPQADIYSLGATLYHMVTGGVPFNGKNPTEVMQKHLKEPLNPPDHVNPKLSAFISEVIEMMMAKSRKQRYKSCAELLTDLQAVRRGEAPPIAHREAAPEALAALARAEQEAPVELAHDKFQKPSPFTDKRVQFLVWILVGLTAYALVMTIVALLK